MQQLSIIMSLFDYSQMVVFVIFILKQNPINLYRVMFVL